MSGIILGTTNANGEMVPQDSVPQKEVASEEVIKYMKAKAMGFDVLMYLLCYDHKSGKMRNPRNLSKYTQPEYRKLMATMKALLGHEEIKDQATWLSVVENYLDFMLKQMGKKSNEE